MTCLRVWMVGLALAALAALAGAPAGAEGELEINAACVAQGCFAGDGPGFPVEITEPGSYRLTSNLFVGSRGTDGIRIQADRVTLDLGGFAIEYCQGLCGVGNGASAVLADVVREGATVRNGTIRAAPAVGVQIGRGGLVEDLYVADCDTGVSADIGSRVVNVTARNNLAVGIDLGRGSVLSRSVAIGNGTAGVQVTESALVVDSVILQNGGTAIAFDGFSQVLRGGYRGSVISGNDGGAEVQPIAGFMADLGGNLCGTDASCP